jgi:potassium efflux system protein
VKLFRREWTPWLMVTGALVVGRALPAQETPPAPGDTAAVQAPQPIPVDSVPAHARAATARLVEFRGRVPADSGLDRLGAVLDTLQDDYDVLRARTTPERLDEMFIGDFTDLENEWNQLQGRLSSWRERAVSLSARVDAVRDSAAHMRERWRLTRATSWSQLPGAVREQVTTLQRTIDSVVREVRPIRERLLSAQGDGAQLDVEVAAGIAEVKAAQTRARRQVLRQDNPPLWMALSRRGDSARADTATTPDSTVSAALPRRFEQAVDYLRRERVRVRLHVALFLILVVTFWLVGRRRDHWATSEFAMHWPSGMLSHPIASGWLLAVTFARAIYPGAPQGVFSLAFLGALPALAVLLRQLLSQPLRVPAYVLLTLYALRTVADTFVWHPLAARFALLALAAVAALAFEWFARLATPSARAGSPWWRSAVLAARLGTLLFGLAIVGNVLGFVTLADILISGTLAFGLAALALVALADVVVGALLVALLATPVGRLEVVRRNRVVVTRRVSGLVHLAAIVFWLSVTLRQFRILRPVQEGIGAFLGAPLTIGSWSFSPGDILLFILTLFLSVHIAGGLRAVLRHDVLSRLDLGRGVPEAASSIAYYLALALGLVFAAGVAGIEFGRLALVAGALGVGIGFGLQTIVANFIAGLILLFERPIKSGDTVELQGLIGVVQSIGIRASVVRTFQGADVIVPNQDLIAGRVTNWTLSDQLRRVEIPVGVAYGSDPAQVIAVMRETTAAHPKVVERPALAVVFVGYGESSLNFEIRLWTYFDDWIDVRSDVLVAVYGAFVKHGITIPFPQRDLHVRSADPTIQDLLRAPTTR